MVKALIFKTSILFLFLFISTIVSAQQVSYLRIWDAGAPEQNPNILMTRPLKNVKQTTQYLNSLGCSLQTLLKQGSIITNAILTDIVSSVVCDAFGREQNKYLPYAYPVSNNYGFKLTSLTQQAVFYKSAVSPVAGQNETFFYSKTNFESSLINRIIETSLPGKNCTGGMGADIEEN